MVIAVNAISPRITQSASYRQYACQLINSLVQAHPEHQFVLLMDKKAGWDYVHSKNQQIIQFNRVFESTTALFFLWNNVKIFFLLKKINANLLIQPFGHFNLLTCIPQILIIHHPENSFAIKSLLFKKLFNQFLLPYVFRKAKCLITSAERNQKTMQSLFPFNADKVKLIKPSPDKGFQPLEWEQKAQVKNAFTEGNDYFLCIGSESTETDLVNILRAYSLFKKWTKSNMKLLIADSVIEKNKSLQEKIETYKYRQDLIIFSRLTQTERKEIYAAAYALIYISDRAMIGLPLLELMQSGTPVIATANNVFTETAENAAILVESTDFSPIAEAMQRVYKDEKYRQQLIEKGFERIKTCSLDTEADLFWKEILLTVEVSS